MISPALPAYFCSTAPLKKLKEISPFPFTLDLVPLNPAFIYDLERLEEEEIDLETNMFWYRVPSLHAVVFYRWIEAPEDCVPPFDSPKLEEEVDEGFIFEIDDGSGQPVDIGPDSIYHQKYFTMLPCLHEEAEEFYHTVVPPHGRELLQREFMEALDAQDEPLYADELTSEDGLDEWSSQGDERDYQEEPAYQDEDESPPIHLFD